jgi:hypothetical protein
MKLALAAAILIATITGASAQLYGSQPSYSGGLYGTGSNPSDHSVSGYTRSNGTYVAPHYQTNPNNTQLDNYGTRGNYNPHTGAYGTHSPRW